MRHLAAVLALLISMSSAELARAQDPVATPRDARVERALTMVDDALTTAASLRLAANRVRLRLAAAQTLWAYDRDRARRVVVELVGDFNSEAARLAAVDWREEAQLRSELMSLRQQLLNELVQQDPQLALDVLMQTRSASQGSPKARYGFDSERELELQIASAVAATDPKRALDVAEAGLARGLSYQIVSLLQQLRAKDPAAATRLASEVVTKIKESNILVDPMACAVAGFLIGDDLGRGPDDTTSPLLSPTDQRILEDLFFGALLALRPGSQPAQELGRAQSLTSYVESLLDPLSRRSPDLAAALRRKIDEVRSALGRVYGRGAGMMQNYDKATADDLLKAADDAAPENRDNLYMMAAEKARAAGDIEGARSIVDTHIADPSIKGTWVENIDREALYAAMAGGRIDEARALISRIGQPAERVGLLIQLAQNNGKPHDSPETLTLLQEAEAIVGERPANTQFFQSRLSIAQAYVGADNARAFAIIESSVDQLDRLLEAAAAMEGFGCEQVSDGGELLLYGGSNLMSFVPQIAQTLGQLASTDPERAATAAARFSRGEARSLTLLAVARAALDAAAGRTPPAAADVVVNVSEP